MKKIYKTILLSIAPAMCFACGSSGLPAGSDPVKLAADSVAVGQVLQPRSQALAGDRAVMVSPKSGTLFWVYRLPDFKYLYSQGKTGEGPDDFVAGGFLGGDACSPEIYLNQPSRSSVVALSAGDEGLARKGTFKIPRNFRARCVAGAGRWLLGVRFIPGDPMGRERLYVLDPKDGTAKDSVVVHTFSRETRSGRSVMVAGYNDMSATARENRVAVLYQDVLRTDLFDISPQGKLQPVATIGDTAEGQALWAKIEALGESAEKTVLAGFSATEKYLYQLEVHAKFDVEARKIDFVHTRVRVYDWDGRAVRVFELEKPATYILVQRDDSRIFAYNTMTGDFDRVYVYRTGF